MNVEQAINLQAEINAKIAENQKQIELHQRVGVLDTMIDKAAAEVSRLSIDVQALKESVADLSSQKAAAVRAVAQTAVMRMSQLLPTGKAIIDIMDDDSVFIGWHNGSHAVPYAGLSGGERVTFDMALSSALLPEKSNKVLIVEAGELDTINIELLLERIANNYTDDLQIICNSCHWVDDVQTKAWKVFTI